jgi:hypothetical protein
MTTSYVSAVWRNEVTATKVTDEEPVSPIVMIPSGIRDFSIFLVGSASASAKVTQSPSSPEDILMDNSPVWVSVHNSLDAVGTSMVAFPLSWVPVALRVESLLDDETATLIVTGRRT